MKHVQDNIREAEIARANLVVHPMCLRLEECKHYAIAIFPYNAGGIDGVRVSLANGKANAYKTLISKCEQGWEDSRL